MYVSVLAELRHKVAAIYRWPVTIEPSVISSKNLRPIWGCVYPAPPLSHWNLIPAEKNRSRTPLPCRKHKCCSSSPLNFKFIPPCLKQAPPAPSSVFPQCTMEIWPLSNMEHISDLGKPAWARLHSVVDEMWYRWWNDLSSLGFSLKMIVRFSQPNLTRGTMRWLLSHSCNVAIKKKKMS